MKKRKKGISIKLVAALNSVFTIIVLTAAIVIIGYLFYQKNVMANYKKYVKTVLEYADSVSKDYAFGDMIAAREMPEGYEKMREGLNRIKANSDKNCADPVLTTKTPVNQNRCDNATISCIILIMMITTDSTSHKFAVVFSDNIQPSRAVNDS